jgi:hypothetical protein
VNYQSMSFDPANPNPWQALYLDQSVPLPDDVKAAWLRCCSSPSRQYLLPVVRPLARLMIVFIQLLKILLPRTWSAPRALHWLISKALATFVMPDANYLILRHFHVGSENLQFLANNIQGVTVQTQPLRPLNLSDLRNNTFVQHDVNLFNFIIQLNTQLRNKQANILPKEKIDFSMISEGNFNINTLPNGLFNIIDIETAIEIFTPIYQLLLSDDDFWRATNSLQLDETIGVYAAQVLQAPEYMFLINNKHPLAQMITLTAGWRLVLHGLSAEMLHGLLKRLKGEQMNKGAPLW